MALLSALCIIAGFVLFIAGGITAVTSRSFGFPVLVGVGFGVLFLGMIVMMVGCITIQVRFSRRLQQAIAAESAKYSMRSPTPCSWRLNTSSYSTGGYNNRRTVTIYRVSGIAFKEKSSVFLIDVDCDRDWKCIIWTESRIWAVIQSICTATTIQWSTSRRILSSMWRSQTKSRWKILFILWSTV